MRRAAICKEQVAAFLCPHQTDDLWQCDFSQDFFIGVSLAFCIQ
jgi:hypothetical protein